MRTHNNTEVSSDAQKCIPNEPKYIPTEPKYIPNEPKYIPDEPKYIPNVNPCECTDCGKVFATFSSKKRHMKDRCKGKIDKHECPYCQEVFTALTNRYRHVKKCKEKHSEQGTKEVEASTTNIQTQVNNNIESQVNNIDNSVNNNITYNQTVVLNFPESIEDDNFKLNKDHITLQRLESLFNRKFQPKQGFARYTSAIMECAENRNVCKTSPNTKYTRVCRDGEWLYELDEEVFPTLTYHISVAAIDDINNHKKELKKGGKVNYVEVAQCLDDINTENDENDNYSYALEKLKIAVLNFTQRFGLPIGLNGT